MIGEPVDDTTPVVLERFAKVWPPPVDVAVEPPSGSPSAADPSRQA
jgi:hypothetical protein